MGIFVHVHCPLGNTRPACTTFFFWKMFFFCDFFKKAHAGEVEAYMSYSREYTALDLLQPWEYDYGVSDDTLIKASYILPALSRAKKKLKEIKNMRPYSGILQARRYISDLKMFCIRTAREARVKWSAKGWGGWTIERLSWKHSVKWNKNDQLGWMKYYTYRMIRNLIDCLKRNLNKQ